MRVRIMQTIEEGELCPHPGAARARTPPHPCGHAQTLTLRAEPTLLTLLVIFVSVSSALASPVSWDDTHYSNNRLNTLYKTKPHVSSSLDYVSCTLRNCLRHPTLPWHECSAQLCAQPLSLSLQTLAANRHVVSAPEAPVQRRGRLQRLVDMVKRGHALAGSISKRWQYADPLQMCIHMRCQGKSGVDFYACVYRGCIAAMQSAATSAGTGEGRSPIGGLSSSPLGDKTPSLMPLD